MPKEPVAAALTRLSKAQAKCAAELHVLSNSHAASSAWASAGIAAAVRLCHDPASAAAAAATLSNLSHADDANDDRIREAGAIPLLVGLLTGGATLGPVAGPLLVAMGGLEAEAAGHAATALANLGHSNKANSVAIGGAGAIPPLVALLSGGPKSKAAAEAAGALASLALNIAANTAAIIEAGAIPPLVALLSGGPDSEAADNAASALLLLACCTNPTAMLEEMARKQTDLSSWPMLRERLCKRASAGLLAAEAGTAVAALERAITLAAAVQMDAADLERAQKRLRVINGDAERQERRESFGLGSLELPDEFVCPITMDQMRGVPPPPSQHAPLAHRRHTCPACAADPVVASDGHSYERSAILSVLRDGNGLSPLTRERLQPNVLILNRNLKRRMQEHEEDILRAAATAVANATDGAQQQDPAACGGEPSSEPAPKRSRPAR